MEKAIKIGNYEVAMKCSGLTPKRYRDLFGKDVIVELARLSKYMNTDGTLNLDNDIDMSVIERLAYTMAMQGGETADYESWLDKFDATDIFDSMGEIIALWLASNKTLSNAKKK